MVRARWTALYRGQPQLQTAYALESVLDELCFILERHSSRLIVSRDAAIYREGKRYQRVTEQQTFDVRQR